MCTNLIRLEYLKYILEANSTLFTCKISVNALFLHKLLFHFKPIFVKIIIFFNFNFNFILRDIDYKMGIVR